MQVVHAQPSPIVHKNLPLFLSGLAFLFIVLGVGSIFFLQPVVQQQNFDTRNQASVNTGLVTLTSSFQDVSAYDPNAHISLLLNTHGVQTDGVQVVFNVIAATTDNLIVNVPSSSGLQATHQEVQKTADGFLVSITATPPAGQTFSSNQDLLFATLDFKPTAAGSVNLSFDGDHSVVNVHGSNPPDNELKSIPAFSYQTQGFAAASPSPSPANTSDDLFFVPSSMSINFYTTDGSNQQIGQNNLQFNTLYRAVINFQVQNTYKTQNPGSASFTVQYLRNGAVVASKVYTYAFVTTHQDGFSDSFTDYFYNQPNNQFTLNLDSTNAIAETNESNNSWTFATTTSAGNSCNQYCSSDSNCAANLRCYNNQCRLATNVTSDSCSTPADQGLQRQCNQYCANTGECASGYTCFYNQCRLPQAPDDANCAGLTTTASLQMSQSCNTSCSSNGDCAVNLRCYNGACRLATNVSSLSCSPQTYPTVSVIYQTSTGTTGTKGQEIPLPPSLAGSSTSSETATSSESGLIMYPTPSPAAVLPSAPASSSSFNVATSISQSLSKVVGSSLALIAIVAGIILLLMAVLAGLLSSSRRRKPPTGLGGQTTRPLPTQPVSSSSAPLTPVENKLATRIKDLEKQQTVSSSPFGQTAAVTASIPKPTPAPMKVTPSLITPPPSVITPKNVQAPTQVKPTVAPQIQKIPPLTLHSQPVSVPVTSQTGSPAVHPTSAASVSTPTQSPVAQVPIAQLPRPTSAPVKITSVPTPAVAPAVTPSSSSPSSSAPASSSTMMQKMKFKGLNQNIPQPVAKTQPTSVSPDVTKPL